MNRKYISFTCKGCTGFGYANSSVCVCVFCAPDRVHLLSGACIETSSDEHSIIGPYPPFGGKPPHQLPGTVYSLPPKGAGTSVASQLPCEYRFLESVSWAVQAHFLSEILGDTKRARGRR